MKLSREWLGKKRYIWIKPTSLTSETYKKLSERIAKEQEELRTAQEFARQSIKENADEEAREWFATLKRTRFKLDVEATTPEKIVKGYLDALKGKEVPIPQESGRKPQKQMRFAAFVEHTERLPTAKEIIEKYGPKADFVFFYSSGGVPELFVNGERFEFNPEKRHLRPGQKKPGLAKLEEY